MKTLKHGLILFGLFCAVFLIAEYALSADINGQLKKAQLEQLGSDPTASTSRIYYNTGDATFRYYNGAWRTIVDTSTALAATRNINTTSPLTGGGNLTADRTIAIPMATTSADGYLSSTDWTTFNGKVVTPAFTAGSVPFATGANTLSQDNSNFFWDSANARLGIGTSTFFNAAAKLEVSSGSDVRFALSNTADGNASFWLRTNGANRFVFNSNSIDTEAVTLTALPLSFGTNNTLGLTLDGSNNVGVGTTAPVSLLSVGSGSKFQVNSTGNIVKLNDVTTTFPAAHGTTNQCLSDSDGAGTLAWETVVLPARTISTTAPLTGGGDLSADRTLAISAATSSAVGTISYEDSGTFACNFTAGAGVSGSSTSATCAYTRVGKTVTLLFPGISATIGTTAGNLDTSAAAIPAALRPVTAGLSFLSLMVESGTVQTTPGRVIINTDGSISFRLTINSGTNWTASHGNCGPGATAWTYTIQ